MSDGIVFWKRICTSALCWTNRVKIPLRHNEKWKVSLGENQVLALTYEDNCGWLLRDTVLYHLGWLDWHRDCRVGELPVSLHFPRWPRNAEVFVPIDRVHRPYACIRRERRWSLHRLNATRKFQFNKSSFSSTRSLTFDSGKVQRWTLIFIVVDVELTHVHMVLPLIRIGLLVSKWHASFAELPC